MPASPTKKRVVIWFDPEAHAFLKDAAARDGFQFFSEWVRTTLLRHAQQRIGKVEVRNRRQMQALREFAHQHQQEIAEIATLDDHAPANPPPGPPDSHPCRDGRKPIDQWTSEEIAAKARFDAARAFTTKHGTVDKPKP
jgi:hypothetical protein